MKIGTILAVVAAFLCVAAKAQTNIYFVSDTAQTLSILHHLDEVCVQGLAGNSKFRESPAPIGFVRADALQSLASSNIIDAVSRRVPGFDKISTGSAIAKPVIRGLGYNRIVTINNGVRQEGQQWGDEHGIEIDAQTSTNVEVIKGPACLLYGSDAMAGVLIFHHQPMPLDSSFAINYNAEYQTNMGLFANSAQISGRRGMFFGNMRLSMRTSHDYQNARDGYVGGTSSREWALSGTAGLTNYYGVSRLIISSYNQQPTIADGEVAGSSSYSADVPFQKIAHLSIVADHLAHLPFGDLQIVGSYQQNRRREFDDSPDECGLHLLQHTATLSVVARMDELPHDMKSQIGCSAMRQISGNHGSEFLVPDYSISDFGVFAAAQKVVGNVDVSGGVRFDFRHLASDALEDDGQPRFRDFERNFSAFTGSFGAVWHAGENFDVRANVARGFRAPNISELASNGVHEGTQHYEVGSTSLHSEQSLQTDLGLHFACHFLHSDVSLFYNRINNYIFQQRIDGEAIDDCPLYTFTQGTAALTGGEASLDVHPVERLHIYNSFAFVRSFLLHRPSDERDLPQTPAPKYHGEATYDFARIVTASFSVDCCARQTHYFKVADTESPTDGYCVLGASLSADVISRKSMNLGVSLSVDNIADKVYCNHLSRLKYIGDGYCDMGRNFTLKISLRL